jgi:hypothetical protein
MTQSHETRVERIKKLLALAERGATEEERDAFNAKATALMVQWGIEDAMLNNQPQTGNESITTRLFRVDVPKAYSYEYAKIGIQIANALGAKGLYQKKADGSTECYVIGFESDLERISMLIQSLSLQATMAMASWWRINGDLYTTASMRWKARRSFITGFAAGLKDKLATVVRQTVSEAGHGAELVLVDRSKQVERWAEENIKIGTNRARNYYVDGHRAGAAAGRQADIGQGSLSVQRRGIGR